LETEQSSRFKINAQQLESAITNKTRLFVLNSPSNPTGVSYTKAELTSLGEVLRKHPHVMIATDDMYEHILWTDEPFSNILNVCPDLYDRTFVLNGVSKAYSMTGWRIGYAAGPTKVIAAMKKIQSQSTSNPCSISQAAAAAALNGSQACIKEMVTEFKKRHDYLVAALNELPGVECINSDGTFYAFPNFQAAIDANPNTEDDIAMAEFLLSDAGVALVPGSAFGAPGCMRLSFATSMEILQEAIVRLKKVLI
ncbi:MAG: aspartate aminotransferase, partial [Oleiphilaceae bacterium]